MSYINDNMFAKAVRYIYNNIDKPIELEDVASNVGLSLSSLINNLTIQSITEVGLYFESAARAWEKLKNALTEQAINDDFSGIFIGIGHDNPHEGGISEDQVRFTAGITLLDKELHLSKMVIANGQYARFRYKGKPVNLGMAYHYIYGKWQENSNRKINKIIPAFVAYDRFPLACNEENALIHVPVS